MRIIVWAAVFAVRSDFAHNIVSGQRVDEENFHWCQSLHHPRSGEAFSVSEGTFDLGAVTTTVLRRDQV